MSTASKDRNLIAIRLLSRWLLRIVFVSLAIITSTGITLAEGDAPLVSNASGKAAGIIAGITLALLVIYALYSAARPVVKTRDSGLGEALLALFAWWIVKSILVAFSPGFGVDVGTFEAWGLDIAQHGPLAMYRAGSFLDYPPGYLYALWGAGALAHLLDATGATLRVIIETPALAADFALAALMFVIVRRHASRAVAWLALAFVALNPALLFDTVFWGQSDSVLALVMLLSAVMMLDDDIELGWALAALALLIKPQAIMLIPVLGIWTLLKASPGRWLQSALVAIAIVVIGVAPFQLSHPWNWLPDLYLSTAAYYHETSVNAFNLMALLGGLRQNDSTLIFGISYFSLGLALVSVLYIAIIVTLWRNPSRRNFWMMSFLALFGFFMLAPRMHERYLYPAVVFAIPLALQESSMLAVFALITLTGIFNLAYVLHTLNTVVFLDAHDGPAMLASLVNCIALALTAVYAFAPSPRDPVESVAADTYLRPSHWLAARFAGARAKIALQPAPRETYQPLTWIRTDTLLLLLLTGAAALLRFWHLNHPPEIVFDEVHFVGQARHYLHNEPFLDPHPPIAKLVIASGIYFFGDHPWAWRIGNALLGTILVAVTYLLGRRMFRSRMAAGLAAALICADGFFIVDSRIACIDIVYVTFAAISYLLLFRFMQTSSLASRRLLLIPLGIVLGLCLGAKLYVPGITFLLVVGFMIFTLWRPQSPTEQRPDSFDYSIVRRLRLRRTLGGLLMTGAIATIFYIVSFTPHYALGWWGGIADLFHYYKDVMWYEKSVSTATHPYASPWWSWPLMLRPVAYWQDFPAKGNIVATIWGAGNPLTWWAVIPAMAITAVHAAEHPTVTRIFLVIGFLAYFIIWIPIGRILFLYHYFPSVHLGYLALGLVLSDLWFGSAEPWEGLAILLTIFPVILIGLGHMATEYKPEFIPPNWRAAAGIPVAAIVALGYFFALRDERRAMRWAVVLFLATAFILFIYYLPIWLGTPISRTGYYARMWFEGPGLRNWI